MKRDVPHFRIGLLLTESGILAPKQLDEAIQRGEQTGLPFLKVLVSEGSLSQHELQAVIRAQALIWSGLLDMERAIGALHVVHQSNSSLEDGLRSIGWRRPEGSAAETMQGYVNVQPVDTANTDGNGSRVCQYCGTRLQDDTVLCSFCTGDNSRISVRLKSIRTPATISRQAESMDTYRILAAPVPRDPAIMAFLSGMCLAGVGQMLVGQVAKGICLAFLFLLCAFLTGGISSLLILPIAALDAYLLADKLRRGKSIGPWEFF